MRTTPPFRADHVGSLLRPPKLLGAREDFAAGLHLFSTVPNLAEWCELFGPLLLAGYVVKVPLQFRDFPGLTALPRCLLKLGDRRAGVAHLSRA